MSKMPSCPLTYHEIDFASNTTEKIRVIKQTPSLLSVITSQLDDPDSLLIAANGHSLFSTTYNIHALDLRTINSTAVPAVPNLSSTAPTLVISECCLIYLPPELTSHILKTFTHHLLPSPTPVAVIIYEPTRPNDAFGRVMVSNLASRGIHLRTLHTFDNLTAQRSRLRDSGLMTDQRAADIDFIWEKWVSKAERERVARCEMLDEVEEWILLARHYCVAWGWRDVGDDGVISTAWGDIKGQDGD
jgi:[phosphatase 2A protein]-leucine-carboxy methyltransferase